MAEEYQEETQEEFPDESQPSTSYEPVRRFKRRGNPPVYNGIGNDFEDDKNADFLCPICFEIISEPHMTKCGHTFCNSCIHESLEHTNRCPKCNYIIESSDELFPNFLLNDLIVKHQKVMSEKKQKLSSLDSLKCFELQNFMANESDKLTILDVNNMLEVLTQKKQQLEADCLETQVILLREFLEKVQNHKKEELQELSQHINIVESDCKVVEHMIETKKFLQPNSPFVKTFPKTEHSYPSTSKICHWGANLQMQEGFNGSKYSGKRHLASSLSFRRKRMHAHFTDLEQSYLSCRTKDMAFSPSGDTSSLDEFTKCLSKFTRFSAIRPLANLNYAHDQFNASNIVSSIEFDKDNEFFGIAGVTKKIKIFEYGCVVRDACDVTYPVNEMMCNSKISCISWSSYYKPLMASSDYEGTVYLWDAFTSQKTKTFQEHEKRCWSVDFNRVDAKLLASGSDDSKVKLWSTHEEHSLLSLDAKANVCCVKFNPESRYHITFGAADHCVHYYDLRNPKYALEVFKGHKKAVSYVKFLNASEVVSASTDSQLKLWNVNQSSCLRTFRSHRNEKNFVGLSTDGDFIACGSENNSLYIYYKGLTLNLLTFRFDSVKSIVERGKFEDDANEFVSAVCWKMGTNVVIAANSQGTIKVLELE